MDQSCDTIHLNEVLYVLFLKEPTFCKLKLLIAFDLPLTTTVFTATAYQTATTVKGKCRQNKRAKVERKLFSLL